MRWLTTGCGAGVAGYTVKREYFTRWFADTQLNEDWATASLDAFNAPESRVLVLPYLRPALDSLRWIQQNRRIFYLGSWLGAFLDAGARLAEPGEFTRRAFLNGRLDLAQAESVADLIDAASREAARSALRSLSGEFSQAIGALVAGLTELRALTEAMLDFPEEEVESLHREDARSRLAAARASLGEVLDRSRRGSLLRAGIHVVLAGPPNVGKSSLLNRLAGEERAIVTPIPGTTRDALRETIQIEGVPVNLVDTAGLRDARDEIERLGIERTLRELGRADVVLAVHDASSAERSPPEGAPEGAARIQRGLIRQRIAGLTRQRGGFDRHGGLVVARQRQPPQPPRAHFV